MPETRKEKGEASIKELSLQVIMPAVLTWSFLPLASLLPLIDPTTPPYFTLTETIPQLACWASESGGKYGCTIVTILIMILLGSRTEVTSQKRLKQTAVIALTATIFGGGGAALNEHVIKTQIQFPRPNILFLAGENSDGPLKMSAQEFYQSGNRKVRSTILAKTLTTPPRPVQLSPAVEAQWIQEVGYSFPSGHSFSAMFFATFLLMMVISYRGPKKSMICYLLLPWALAICYSRPILRLHTPLDITIGGLLGLVVGVVAFAFARLLINKFP